MTNAKESTGRVEWRIRMTNDSSEVLVPESKLWVRLKGMMVNWAMKVHGFFKKAWDLGADDPRKVMHCLKVGIALSVVSIFYYMRPLNEGVGGNALWAVMTVVVVFEYSVGSTLYKCLNRICGTSLAGFLAIGVHWVARQSGEKFEPIIMGASVFLLASATTFSRFIPVVKARFDYGAMIFILTFSLVSVSGFRVEKLLELAHERLATIIIGTSLCILTSMLVCPIWAGEELYCLITRNMDKLANSLDSYKCVLNSKATEESMAGFARWEPAHGRFNFKHPWKQYLKIGASMRNCAYCIETLNSCLNSENQVPEFIKKHLNEICMRVSSNSSRVIKELATTIKTMRRSTNIDVLVEEMNDSVLEFQEKLKSLPSSIILETEAKNLENEKKEPILENSTIPLLQVIPVVTFASLLIETAGRVEGIVEVVDELANLAEFKPADDYNLKQIQQDHDNKVVPDRKDDKETMMTTLQRV
ncbi:hypothetical protein LguiA_034441 [Lonicera macranthoides]